MIQGQLHRLVLPPRLCPNPLSPTSSTLTQRNTLYSLYKGTNHEQRQEKKATILIPAINIPLGALPQALYAHALSSDTPHSSLVATFGVAAGAA
jgi:hypothetical protein